MCPGGSGALQLAWWHRPRCHLAVCKLPFTFPLSWRDWRCAVPPPGPAPPQPPRTLCCPISDSGGIRGLFPLVSGPVLCALPPVLPLPWVIVSPCLSRSLPPFRPCSPCLAAGPDERDHVSPCCPRVLLRGAEGGQEDLCAVSWWAWGVGVLHTAAPGGGAGVPSTSAAGGAPEAGRGISHAAPAVVPLWAPARAPALWSPCLPWPGWLSGPAPRAPASLPCFLSCLPLLCVVLLPLWLPTLPVHSGTFHLPSVPPALHELLSPQVPVCPSVSPVCAGMTLPCPPVSSVSRCRALRSSFLLLLLVSASWLFGLLAVNHSVLAFHYLHAALCGLQVTGDPPSARPGASAGEPSPAQGTAPGPGQPGLPSTTLRLLTAR